MSRKETEGKRKDSAHGAQRERRKPIKEKTGKLRSKVLYRFEGSKDLQTHLENYTGKSKEDEVDPSRVERSETER